MKYFVKTPGSSETIGPYSVEEIEARLKTGELFANALATGDTGDNPGNVAQSPATVWIHVHQIPGLGVNPPPLPSLEEQRLVVCPNCSQQFSATIATGETSCPKCGKSLAPAAKKRAGPHPLVVFLIHVPGGFLAQMISFVFLCSFASISKSHQNGALILWAVILCLAWIAFGIALIRSRANQGYAFGIFIGVGVTGLLTATCAVLT